MSSSINNRFISESELEEQRKLYGGKQKDIDPNDNRTLFERLQENKRIKEEAIVEKTKFKPSQGLDKDDIEHYKEKERIEQERKNLEKDEIEKELEDFKKSQATNLLNSIASKAIPISNSNEIKTTTTTNTLSSTTTVTTKRKLLNTNIKLIPTTVFSNNNTTTTTSSTKKTNDNDENKVEEKEESNKKLKIDNEENKDTNTNIDTNTNTLIGLIGNYDTSSSEDES